VPFSSWLYAAFRKLATRLDADINSYPRISDITCFAVKQPT
jgi:hypothetical protein